MKNTRKSLNILFIGNSHTYYEESCRIAAIDASSGQRSGKLSVLRQAV